MDLRHETEPSMQLALERGRCEPVPRWPNLAAAPRLRAVLAVEVIR
jgi:hypothetical protein